MNEKYLENLKLPSAAKGTGLTYDTPMIKEWLKASEMLTNGPGGIDTYEIGSLDLLEAIETKKVAAPKEMTTLEKLMYIKKWLDTNRPEIAGATLYLILSNAIIRVTEDAVYKLNPTERSAVKNLFEGYKIPRPGHSIQSIGKYLTIDDLLGAMVVFTGFRSSELTLTLTQQYGVTVQSKVTVATNIVVTRNAAKSTRKIVEAEENGAQIIPLTDLSTLLGYKPDKKWN